MQRLNMFYYQNGCLKMNQINCLILLLTLLVLEVNLLLENREKNDVLGAVIREETNEILVIQERISLVGSKKKKRE